MSIDAQLDNLLKDVGGIAKDHPKQLQTELTSTFDSKEGQAIVEEVKRVGRTANAIRENFIHVQSVLRTFDSKKYVKKDGTRVDALEGRWSEYAKKFDDYLKESKKVALKGKVRAEEYLLITNNLEDPDFKKADIVGSLENYLKDIASSESEAAQVRANFEKLQTEVSGFTSVIDAVVKDAGEAIDADVEAANKSIQALEAKLASLKKFIENCSGIMKAGAAVTACGAALAATGALAPLATALSIIGALAALGSKIASSIAEAKLADTEADLVKAKDNLAKLKDKQAEFNKIKLQLDGAKDDIVDLASKLGVIVNIWTAFEQDAGNIKREIEKAKDETDLAVIKRNLGMNVTGAVYRRFGEVLGDYAASLK